MLEREAYRVGESRPDDELCEVSRIDKLSQWLPCAPYHQILSTRVRLVTLVHEPRRNMPVINAAAILSKTCGKHIRVQCSKAMFWNREEWGFPRARKGELTSWFVMASADEEGRADKLVCDG